MLGSRKPLWDKAFPQFFWLSPRCAGHCATRSVGLFCNAFSHLHIHLPCRSGGFIFIHYDPYVLFPVLGVELTGHALRSLTRVLLCLTACLPSDSAGISSNYRFFTKYIPDSPITYMVCRRDCIGVWLDHPAGHETKSRRLLLLCKCVLCTTESP